MSRTVLRKPPLKNPLFRLQFSDAPRMAERGLIAQIGVITGQRYEVDDLRKVTSLAENSLFFWHPQLERLFTEDEIRELVTSLSWYLAAGPECIAFDQGFKADWDVKMFGPSTGKRNIREIESIKRVWIKELPEAVWASISMPNRNISRYRTGTEMEVGGVTRNDTWNRFPFYKGMVRLYNMTGASFNVPTNYWWRFVTPVSPNTPQDTLSTIAETMEETYDDDGESDTGDGDGGSS